MNALDALRKHSLIVADSGEFAEIEQYQPIDCTTNPSLILNAVSKTAYQEYFAAGIAAAKATQLQAEALVDDAVEALIVEFGSQIANRIDGRVSSEVFAAYSFDCEKTIAQARSLIARYEARGIDRARILIKIAATWEGIEAARVLENEGIHCNLTLLFNLTQAIACAEAGVFLISPFVGRVLDWYKAKTGQEYHGAEDPGVQSVQKIYSYYKDHGYSTLVMAASFRNTEEILHLAGCDLLTISPKLLDELSQLEIDVPIRLNRAASPTLSPPAKALDEATFRWQMNQDAMATEKLAEGIRRFDEDTETLKTLIRKALAL